jgi:hypothetical protein
VEVLVKILVVEEVGGVSQAEVVMAVAVLVVELAAVAAVLVAEVAVVAVLVAIGNLHQVG